MEIPHSLSDIGQQELNNVLAVLRSGYLKGGPFVKQLQDKIASDTGMVSALSTHTGSLAIFLALKALDLPEGSKIAVPAYVCKAVPAAVRMACLIPLFFDVSPRDCCLSAESLATSFDETVRAIIPAHLFGNISDIRALRNFNTTIIEDAAQCPGAKGLGKYSDMVVFSFEGTKMLCAGEAGVLVFRNSAMKQRAEEFVLKGDICSLTPTDLQAAVALAQWEKRDEIIKRRFLLAQRYNQAFSLRGIKSIINSESVISRYVIKNCQNVDQMITKADKEGICLRRPIDPKGIATSLWKDYPVTRHLVLTNLSLPIYPGLTERNQERVIRFVIDNIQIEQELPSQYSL